jgi:hypothetical protein
VPQIVVHPDTGERDTAEPRVAKIAHKHRG